MLATTKIQSELNIMCGSYIIKVYVNPTDDNFYELCDKFNSENFNMQGEPKTRHTFDTNDNEYMWMSTDAMHYVIEGYLLKKGIKANQNKYFDLD